MEETKTPVKKLLSDPYRQVLLQDYERAVKDRKHRRKLEEIEKELSWFNGKAVSYRTEDRQGFFNHFRTNYGSDRAGLAPVYRSICEYPGGQEPKLMYFVLLFVKRQQQIQEFQHEHPVEELKGSISLSLEYRRLVNEYRLLGVLLEHLGSLVKVLERSIDECFVTDFLADEETLSLPVLQSRFYRAVRMADAGTCERLLDGIRKAGGKHLSYMEAMLALKKKDYAAARQLADEVTPEQANYTAAMTIALECCAFLGDTRGFAETFARLKDTRIDAMFFVYLLQTLVCSADYRVLDTDEFEASVQKMMKADFIQEVNPVYTGLVSRKFIAILMEGLPLAERLAAIRKESGEDALPVQENEQLGKLQMAMQLCPSKEIGDLIDMDYLDAHGAGVCRERIACEAVVMLLEKNPDKSFENVSLAFRALEWAGMEEVYAGNVEKNLSVLIQYGERGRKEAWELIKKAREYRAREGRESKELEEACRTCKAYIE